MSFYYTLIFGGIYLCLILIFLIIWQIFKRFVSHKAQKIILVASVLISFYTTQSLRRYWYDLFTYHFEIMNEEGEIYAANYSFEILDKSDELLFYKNAGNFISPNEYNKLKQFEAQNRFQMTFENAAGRIVSRVRTVPVGTHIDKSFRAIPVLIIAFLINSLLAYFLWFGALIDEEGEPVVPKLLRQLASIVIYLIAAIIVAAIVYPEFLDRLLVTIGTSGAVAAFLGKEPVKQAFTALSLNINKQIRKGDWLELNDYYGQVQEIGWKSIKLLTPEKNLLTIPNIILVNSHLINHSQPNEYLQVWVEVVIDTTASPAKVKQVLSQAAKQSELLKGEPNVNLVEMHYRQAKYLIEVPTSHHNANDVKGEVLSAVWQAIRRENLSRSQKSEEISEPIEKAKKLLASVPLFEAFTKEEYEQLAKSCEWVRFGYPEKIVTQGNRDSALFVVAEGEVDILLRQPDGSNKPIPGVVLKEKSFFGEMALLTGEERKASVRALNEVLLCKISKSSIKPILDARPEVLEALSDLLAERVIEMEQASKDKKGKQKSPKQGVAKKLLGLMRNFFTEEGEEEEKKDQTRKTKKLV